MPRQFSHQHLTGNVFSRYAVMRETSAKYGCPPVVARLSLFVNCGSIGASIGTGWEAVVDDTWLDCSCRSQLITHLHSCCDVSVPLNCITAQGQSRHCLRPCQVLHHLQWQGCTRSSCHRNKIAAVLKHFIMMLKKIVEHIM